MALGDAYATAAQYKSVRGITETTNDTAIARDLLTVSRFLDKLCGRPLGFNTDATNVARVYTVPARGPIRPGWAEAENPWKAGGMTRVLDIDDHASVATIEVDEHLSGTYSLTLAGTDYELLPRNATSLPLDEPYRQIRLTEWGTVLAWTPNARVRVTGKGGWPSVPDAIVSACIELCAILRVESPRASVSINEMNQVVSMSKTGREIVAAIVDQYRDPRSYI